MAKKILMQKKVGSSVESIYAKTSSDIVIYDESTGESVKSKIDSLELKNNNTIRYGTCSTAESTVNKTVAMTSYELTTNGAVLIKFDYSVPSNATLNINSKGAKPIYYRGAAIKTGFIKAGDIATFVYSTTPLSTGVYILVSIDSSMHTKIHLNSFTSNITKAENGSSNSITLSWNTNIVPVSVTFNNGSTTETIYPTDSVGTKTYSNVSANTTYTITVTDQNGYTDTDSVSVSFMDKIYYGAHASSDTINSAFVKSLAASSLQADAVIGPVKCNISQNQYLYFACPARYEEPMFTINGIVVSMVQVGSSVSVTNDSETVVTYNVYRNSDIITDTSGIRYLFQTY